LPTYPTELLRNLALLSHSGCGKTSLVEALLFSSGAISRLGRVEDGNTSGDYEPEAAKRGGSTQLSILPCPWKNHKITLIDTPGYFDFLGDAESALRVADAGILVVAANAGVEVGTEQMWGRIQTQNLPCFIVVNKLDRENTNFLPIVDRLRDVFGKQCVPIQIPIGTAQGFREVVPLLPIPQEVPTEFAAAYEQARNQLIEAVAETDDDLATKFLESEDISEEELLTAFRNAVVSAQIVPVIATSAIQGVGVKELLDVIIAFAPAPNQLPYPSAWNEQLDEFKLEPTNDGPLAALIFKTTADPYVGKLSFLRVYSGSLKSNSEVFNSTKGQPERIGQLFVPKGKEQELVQSLSAGEIGAVGRLSSTSSGDTLSMKDNALQLKGISYPPAQYSQAVYPKSKADTDKLSTALQRLAEEDPSIRFLRDSETGESLLAGLGDAHVELAVSRAQRKFGVNLVLQTPKIPYKETVSATSKVEHRYRQQSGGHGHYAHILLRLEPLGRGTGLEFASEVTGGNVPKEFIPSVEKGIRRAAADGALAGYPIVDTRAVLYDGSFHPVDSASMDFDMCGFFGMKKGIVDGSPGLLEPIMLLRITTPDTYTGEIIGDLNGRRGRVLGMIPEGDGTTIVEANAPLTGIQRYALDLRSLAQGRASFTMEFSHDEEMPQNLAQKVIEQSKQEKS